MSIVVLDDPMFVVRVVVFSFPSFLASALTDPIGRAQSDGQRPSRRRKFHVRSSKAHSIALYSPPLPSACLTVTVNDSEPLTATSHTQTQTP